MNLTIQATHKTENKGETMRKRNTSTLLITIVAVFLVLSCFGLSPIAQALTPAPDGGYAGGNTAEGDNALLTLNPSTGSYNTAVGFNSLKNNNTGRLNTAVGVNALISNTVDGNTAAGASALISNTTGIENTAVGFQALAGNQTTAENTAVGYQALLMSTQNFNTAVGARALKNSNGGWDTAMGYSALLSNTSGVKNTAFGSNSLANSIDGSNNTVLGFGAGNNITHASNVICIGSGVAGANQSNTCYIGSIYSNIQPVTGIDPDYVTINSSGRLGRGNISSRRYKHDIQPMDKASEALYSLKPVSFRYNKEYDATQTVAFGLIAEEVADVKPELVGRNKKGEAESVRYEQVNVMLLNEFLKAHLRMEEQEKRIEELTAQLKQQAAQIQKVSAEVEVSKSKARTVLNNQ